MGCISHEKISRFFYTVQKRGITYRSFSGFGKPRFALTHGTDPRGVALGRASVTLEHNSAANREDLIKRRAQLNFTKSKLSTQR